MILPLLLLAAAADPAVTRYHRCLVRAKDDAAGAEVDARGWQREGRDPGAGACLGVALSARGRYEDAATAFEAAAALAAREKDDRAGGLWAQAGNAWLAAARPDKARVALTTAIDRGLDGVDLAEAELDRARASVALGDLPTARRDLDLALAGADGDALAWLLSASLARRMDDLPRAHTDIDRAQKLVGDEPEVMLEAGNIAAASGDDAGARLAWTKAAAAAPPGSELATRAKAALAQFDAPPSQR